MDCDGDTDLLAALEESARAHSSSRSTQLVLKNGYTALRSKCRQSAVYDIFLANAAVVRGDRSGIVHQVNLLNQFHSHWAPAIRAHKTASAICGYTSVGIALYLLKHEKHESSSCEICTDARNRDTLKNDVFDDAFFPDVAHVLAFRERLRRDNQLIQAVTREIVACMESVRRSRQMYIDVHGKSWKQREKSKYLCAWVANYEISDLLVEACRTIPDMDQCVFFRYSEWVELHNATHEEATRIAIDDQRFGGTQPGEKGRIASFQSPCRSNCAPDYCVCGGHMLSVERFCPRRLLTPREAAMEIVPFLAENENCPGRGWSVAVVDLNGHFATCVRLGDGGVAILNTTTARYLGSEIVSLVYDLAL